MVFSLIFAFLKYLIYILSAYPVFNDAVSSSDDEPSTNMVINK
jgi:hypothetical protein